MYNAYYQRQSIIKVHGENGARAFQMQPNSSILLLDETEPIVWFAQTDGAGYKTINAYKIEPFTPAPEPNINDIIERLNKLEAMLSESNSEKYADKQSQDDKRPAFKQKS